VEVMSKVFVEAIAKFTKDGVKIPLTVTWEDGRRFEIDRVTDMRRAASLKAGGQGMRYKCRINGKETYLWLEDDKWFVEGKN
jgi:hypothetical protein